MLLADEPISMLDVSIRLGILNLLRDLRDRLQLAILYITHDIASARYFADRRWSCTPAGSSRSGDSESVTQDPKHPYTQLLVALRARPGRPRGAGAGARAARRRAWSARPPAAGSTRAARSPPTLCRTEVPPLIAVGEGREAACWGYADREDRPSLGSVLDAYGERPTVRRRAPAREEVDR